VGENQVLVTVEDENGKIEKVTKEIAEIKEIQLVNTNEDHTKQYSIKAQKGTDIRKMIFEKFAKNGIVIYELKKVENTLEDAFMQLIDKKEGKS